MNDIDYFYGICLNTGYKFKHIDNDMYFLTVGDDSVFSKNSTWILLDIYNYLLPESKERYKAIFVSAYFELKYEQMRKISLPDLYILFGYNLLIQPSISFYYAQEGWNVIKSVTLNALVPPKLDQYFLETLGEEYGYK